MLPNYKFIFGVLFVSSMKWNTYEYHRNASSESAREKVSLPPPPTSKETAG